MEEEGGKGQQKKKGAKGRGRQRGQQVTSGGSVVTAAEMGRMGRGEGAEWGQSIGEGVNITQVVVYCVQNI